MNTAKALIAAVVVTVGLLASSFAFEGIAQLLGPEEEEHVEEGVGDVADEVDLDGEADEDNAE